MILHISKTLSEMKKKKALAFFEGLCVGAIIFILLYGFSIINPMNEGWIYTIGADNMQHQLGWVSYRKSPWTFPIGLNVSLTVNPVSVIYTDSIPIVAIIFKILSPLLPSTFQYLGLCSLLSYMLMGGFAALLLRHVIENNFLCAVLSSLFVLSPYMLHTLFAATSLLGQWTIIAAFCLWLYNPYRGQWKHILLWAILCVVACGLHLYIGVMVMGIMFFAAVTNMIETKRIVYGIGIIGVSVAFVLAYLFLFGMFHGTYGAVTTGTEAWFSANLNGFINPLYQEKLLEPRGSTDKNMDIYMGAGMLICCIILLYRVLIEKISICEYLKLSKLQFIMMILCVTVFFVFALSPVISVGSRELFHIPYPKVILSLFCMLRAKGRFAMVMAYFLYYVALSIVFYDIKDRMQLRCIIMCLLVFGVQYDDLSYSIKEQHNKAYNTHSYESSLSKEVETLLEGKEVVYLPYNYTYWGETMVQYYDIASYAINHDMKLANFYLAREDLQAEHLTKKYEQALKDGEVDEKVVYVFPEENLVPQNCDMTIVENQKFYYGVKNEK